MQDSTDRLHALDAVRGFALILGVFFHASVSFLPGDQAWMIMDTQRSPAAGVTFFVLHMFRMTTFFLIAGFFARLIYLRRGALGFARDRAMRIGRPFVIFLPIVFAFIVGASIWAAYTMYWPNMPEAPAAPNVPFAFPLTHLWFLYVLMIFYVIALAVRGLVALIDRNGALRRGGDVIVRLVGGTVLAPVVLAIPLFAAFALNPGWLMGTGIPTPDNSLIPNPIAFTAYGVAFTFGWLLHRQIPLMNRWKGLWPINFTIAILATLGAMMISGGWETPTFDPAQSQEQALGFAACYALASWSWALGFVGLSLQIFAGFSAWRRYVADASYWVYIMHLPLVIALQTAVSELPVFWLVKYLGVVAVSLAILFGTYHLFVRRSFIGALLNGKKHPKPERATNAQPTQVIAT